MHRLNEQKLINMHANTPFANHLVPPQYNDIKLVFKKSYFKEEAIRTGLFPSCRIPCLILCRVSPKKLSQRKAYKQGKKSLKRQQVKQKNDPTS